MARSDDSNPNSLAAWGTSTTWKQALAFLSPPSLSSLNLRDGDPINHGLLKVRTTMVGFSSLITLLLIITLELDLQFSGQNNHWLIRTMDWIGATICIVLAYQSFIQKKISESVASLFLLTALVAATIAAYFNGLLPLMFFTAIMAFSYLLKPPSTALAFSSGLYLLASGSLFAGNPSPNLAVYLRLTIDFLICLLAWHFHLCLMYRMLGLYQEAVESRSQFLHTVSHELRAPLNGLSGLLYLLHECLRQQAPSSQKQRALGYTEQIEGLHNRISELVNNTLDLNKARAGELHLQMSVTDLGKLCEDVINKFRPRCDAKGLTLKLKHEGLPAHAEIDSERVKQMLHNLLSNAVQFTERGGITLSVGARNRTNEQAMLYFEVCDTGTGIAPHQEASLFQSCSDAVQAGGNEYAGFGLSLVRELATAHGGHYGFCANPAGGSCFWFDVACLLKGTDTLAAKVIKGPKAYDFEGMSILICDDEPMNRFVIEQLLSKRHATLYLAENGRKALEIVHTLSTPCDLIMMDVMMPVVDGFEAMQQIRQVPGWQQVPALCVSGVLDSPDIASKARLVFNDLVTKPLKAEELLAKVAYFRLKNELFRNAIPVKPSTCSVGHQ